jgi:hypothetical protein
MPIFEDDVSPDPFVFFPMSSKVIELVDCSLSG